jgi:predicted nucleic acid-binding protein
MAFILILIRNPAIEFLRRTALTARAEAIVTGDHALLTLGEYRGVRIISLREYLANI